MEVAIIMDTALSLVFLGDFLYRLFTAESKMTYFLRQFGWADLLASLPFPQAKFLRLFRIFHAGRLIRRYGAKSLIHEFVSDRGGGQALLSLLFLMFLVLEFGAIVMLCRAERISADAISRPPATPFGMSMSRSRRWAMATAILSPWWDELSASW